MLGGIEGTLPQGLRVAAMQQPPVGDQQGPSERLVQMAETLMKEAEATVSVVFACTNKLLGAEPVQADAASTEMPEGALPRAMACMERANHALCTIRAQLNRL